MALVYMSYALAQGVAQLKLAGQRSLCREAGEWTTTAVSLPIRHTGESTTAPARMVVPTRCISSPRCDTTLRVRSSDVKNDYGVASHMLGNSTGHKGEKDVMTRAGTAIAVQHIRQCPCCDCECCPACGRRISRAVCPHSSRPGSLRSRLPCESDAAGLAVRGFRDHA